MRKEMMSPGPTLTSVVPPPLELPVSGSITCTVALGIDFDVIATGTPSPRVDSDIEPNTTITIVWAILRGGAPGGPPRRAVSPLLEALRNSFEILLTLRLLFTMA
jgi:hypothetical protein